MSIILSTLATNFALGIITNLSSNVLWDAKSRHNGKKKSEQIKQRITDFIRKYDGTPLDSSEFQQFFNERVVTEIYNAVFKPQTTNGDYLASLPQQAFDAYKERRNANGKTSGSDIGIFRKYFDELIDELNSIRTDLLSFEHMGQTAIIIEEERTEHRKTRGVIRSVKKELVDSFSEMLRSNLGQISNPMIGDNEFAWPTIKEIEALIDKRFFEDADTKINEALNNKKTLSINQIENVLYQQARILINTNKYDALLTIIDGLKGVNPNSKYIYEINYFIACNTKDSALLKASIEELKHLGYPPEKCTLKEMNYLMAQQDYDAVHALLFVNDELITAFDGYHEAHFYCGLLMANADRYAKALYHFEKAYALRNVALYKYYAIQSEYYLLGNNSHGMFFKPESFIEKAKAIKDQLKEYDYLIESLGQEASVNHFVNLLNLTQFIDPNKAISEIESIEPQLLKNVLIKSVVADIYLKHGEIDKAGALLDSIWNYSFHNFLNILIIFQEKGNWDEIILRYRALTDAEYLTNPNIRAIYLQAMFMAEGYEKVKDIVVSLQDEDLKQPEFICEVINILLTQKDTDEYKKLFARIDGQKNTLPIDVMILLNSLLLGHRLFVDVINLCKERAQEDDILFGQYIYSLEGSTEDDASSIPYVYEEVTRLFNAQNRSKHLLRIKAKIENMQNLYAKSIKTLDEYRSLYGMDDFYAYYYVATKYKSQEFNDVVEQCRYLHDSDSPMFQQIVAMIWAKTGRWAEAKRLAIAVLYKNHESVPKEFYGNFVNMFFANIHQDAGEPELTCAVSGSLVTLVSSSGDRRIAIHSDSSLIGREGEYKFGFENYTELDAISLLLTSHGRINESVTVFDEEYIIKEIIRLPSAFVRYCIAKLQTEYPDHGFFKTVSSSTPEEAIDKLKEVMHEHRNSIERYLEFYNFKNFDSGLPISALSGHDIESYTQTIISLLNQNGQHLFAGEVTIFKNQKYVLSLSSIILMSVLGLLDRLKSISQKISITNVVDIGIRQGVREAQQKSKVIAGYTFVTDEGNLSFNSYTEEYKEDKKQFWSDILGNIQSFSKYDVEIQENEYYALLSDWMLKEDFSSIELSKVQKKVLVVDDLFMRKISHAVVGTPNTTNSIGFLISEGLIAPEELLEIVLRLVKFKYTYPISEPIILELLNFIFSIEDEEKRDQQFDKLRAVFNEILSEESRNYYMEMHLALQSREDLPSIIKYELVREPLRLMPWDQLVRKHVQKMLGIDDDSAENGQDELT